MGDIDTLECDNADAHTLLLDALCELDESEWYVGPEDAAWSANVRRETPNLFNVKAAVDSSTGSGGSGSGSGSGDMRLVARTARLGTQTLQVGRMNAAAIGAFWTSLSLEMQYFANDDDERYSIQGLCACVSYLHTSSCESIAFVNSSHSCIVSCRMNPSAHCSASILAAKHDHPGCRPAARISARSSCTDRGAFLSS
jgi:hypothetical protein